MKKQYPSNRELCTTTLFVLPAEAGIQKLLKILDAPVSSTGRLKVAATDKASDFHGLKKLASVAGDQFKMGVLLYDGTETMPLGDRLWAVPLSPLCCQ